VRLSVDVDMCTGHGRCYALAPDVFGADEYGHCEILVDDVDGELLQHAILGVQNCPEQAIKFTDDDSEANEGERSVESTQRAQD
jgi:ferredoxin